MLRTATAILLLAVTPAMAATPDRDTAVSTLAAIFYSVDACSFSISRDKVDAYRAAAQPANDSLFNVDVWRATHSLYATQKDWSKDQIGAWCSAESATIKSLGLML